jgi:PAS domain S-box-containing protein
MRKEAEQALREREAQYRSVVENVRDVVFQTDIDGHWTFLNPAWEGMTGYSVDDTLGNPCLAYFKGPELDAMTEVFDGARSFCRSEVRLRTRDGSVRWVALFAQSLQEEDGALTGVVGTLHDITERKRMEQQTREALRRERELNRLKSSVVSMVSHEFRTPLSTIRSSAEMLGEFFDEWSPEKRKKYVDRIHRQIDRMSRLLGDVITTSKLDAEHDEPNPVPLDLRRFQREVADEVRAHLGTDRAIAVEMHDVPDEIEVDPDLLHHIVSNLLSNALKYSPDDTEVSVSWEVRGETLSVRVSDRGIGIPTSDQEHLFRAFFRASNVDSAEGSGLGMTIVKRAVDVYGGTISVDSTSGEGTTFRITLPL